MRKISIALLIVFILSLFPGVTTAKLQEPEQKFGISEEQHEIITDPDGTEKVKNYREIKEGRPDPSYKPKAGFTATHNGVQHPANMERDLDAYPVYFTINSNEDVTLTNTSMLTQQFRDLNAIKTDSEDTVVNTPYMMDQQYLIVEDTTGEDGAIG